MAGGAENTSLRVDADVRGNHAVDHGGADGASGVIYLWRNRKLYLDDV